MIKCCILSLSRRYCCALVFLVSIVVMGCQESDKEQSSKQYTDQTNIIDAQAVALVSDSAGMAHGAEKALYSEQRPFDYAQNRSVINLRLYSNNAMLLTDPEGRRTGIDPLSGSSYKEIPNGFYGTTGLRDAVTGDPGPETQELTVTRPIDGEFSIRILCSYEEKYYFEIFGYDAAGDFGHILTREIQHELYTVHTYSLRYKKGNEKDLDTMTLRGGYDGTGDERRDGNLLLSYFTCSSSDIELSAGTKQFSLGVWYYEGTDPKSFKATLNGKDISALFTPKANSNGIVTLDLTQGSSSLVLEIEGDMQSQRLIDTDTFEISVSP